MSLGERTIQQEALKKAVAITQDLTVALYHVKHSKSKDLSEAWKQNAKIAIKSLTELEKLI